MMIQLLVPLPHFGRCTITSNVISLSLVNMMKCHPLRNKFSPKFQDENFADPIEIKPLGNSWARTLVGPKDTSQYFNDYFGGSSDTSTYEEVEEFTERPRRPPSPQEYYQQQKYHFTPTEKPMHDADDEGTFRIIVTVISATVFFTSPATRSKVSKILPIYLKMLSSRH